MSEESRCGARRLVPKSAYMIRVQRKAGEHETQQNISPREQRQSSQHTSLQVRCTFLIKSTFCGLMSRWIKPLWRDSDEGTDEGHARSGCEKTQRALSEGGRRRQHSLTPTRSFARTGLGRVSSESPCQMICSPPPPSRE